MKNAALFKYRNMKNAALFKYIISSLITPKGQWDIYAPCHVLKNKQRKINFFCELHIAILNT